VRRQSKTEPAAGPRIERETGIMPDVVAETVVDQVVAYLADDAASPKFAEALHAEKAALAAYLAKYAEDVYANNEKFAKDLRSEKNNGNYGRDTLYAFMRHWLAAEMKTKHRAAFAKLPAAFALGGKP
jgi:hypothetical protein